VKRQLLFFDALLLLLPDDEAILNTGDLSEEFPPANGFPARSITQGPVWKYPRSDDYEDEYRRLRIETQRVQGSGALRFVGRRPLGLDVRETWVAATAATQKTELLRAAIPDFDPSMPPLYAHPASCGPLVLMSVTGFTSLHAWMQDLRLELLDGVDYHWQTVATGRLGRLMKAIRRASLEEAVPLATDAANENMCLTLGSQAYGASPTPDQLAATAVALDAVDPTTLDVALADMSWEDVMKLRKEILPHAKKLRHHLKVVVRAANRPQSSDLSEYIQALNALRDKHAKARDDLRGAWKRLGFKLVEGAIAAAPAGLTAIAPSPEWARSLTAFALGAAFKTVASLPTEIQSIVAANRAKKATVLFAFDRLDQLGKDSLKRQDPP
jgi:hypothetical protein